MNKIIERDWRNARLFRPNVLISDNPPKLEMYVSWTEWLFAVFVAGVFLFLGWVGAQLIRFLMK